MYGYNGRRKSPENTHAAIHRHTQGLTIAYYSLPSPNSQAGNAQDPPWLRPWLLQPHPFPQKSSGKAARLFVFSPSFRSCILFPFQLSLLPFLSPLSSPHFLVALPSSSHSWHGAIVELNSVHCKRKNNPFCAWHLEWQPRKSNMSNPQLWKRGRCLLSFPTLLADAPVYKVAQKSKSQYRIINIIVLKACQ